MREQVLSGVLGLPSPELLTNLQRAMSADIEAVAADPEAEEADEIAAEDEAVEIEEIEEAEEAEPIEKVEAAEEVEPVEEVEEPTEMAASTQMPEETPDDQAVVIPSLEQIGQLARELQEPAKPVTSDLGDLVQPMLLEPSVPERRDVARVEQSVLEELLNNAGEISIFHSRLSQQTNQIQFNLDELGRTVVRLKEQLRALEMATEAQILYQHQSELTTDEGFDPLELDRYSRIQHLSRALAETASDVNSLKDLLQNLTGDTEALLVQQARTASELQDGLMRTRMVPFEQHVARLARLVRQTAAEYGKQAELSIRGGGEIDRQVLEKMLPPFEHMLRNAVVHGIELPEDREAAGKSQVGSVVITVRREGTEVAIEIADDGRGLDVDSIRHKAEEFGFIDSGVDVTDEEAMQLILRSGFSTADTLTQAAGRGVGMDVVANEVAKLGGTLRIDFLNLVKVRHF
jgi:chemosensory pili system protein ChpA (sensor histidine kinase/response regulator)